MSSTAQAFIAPEIAPFENILYATDFSQCSQAAMPYVRALAVRNGSTVHFVHACDSRITAENERRAAEIEMEAEISSNAFERIAHTSTVASGDLWDVLLPIIKEKNVDLIVLGTHGRRGFAKLFAGSAAERIFRHAPCPVLTIGPEVLRDKLEDGSFARLLFATDYSESSLHALTYAVKLAQENRSHFMLLHVMSGKMDSLPLTKESVPPGMQLGAQFVGQALGYAREVLGKVVPPETMRGLNPEVIVECGPVAETILNVSRKKDADLIVIGAHRGFSTHLPWAVASSVICEAHCPVFTLRS